MVSTFSGLLLFQFRNVRLLTGRELDVRRVDDGREIVPGSGATEPVQDRVNARLGRRRRHRKSEPSQLEIRHFRHRNDRRRIFRVEISGMPIRQSVDRIGEVEGGQELDRLRRLHERVKAGSRLLVAEVTSLRSPKPFRTEIISFSRSFVLFCFVVTVDIVQKLFV